MNERNIFDYGGKISSDQFGRLFSDFKSRAFRLESLPAYKVPEEADQYTKFKNGESLLPNNREWYENIRSLTKSGKRFERVRVVHNPVQTYLKFEIEIGYFQSLDHGEMISLISEENFLSIALELPIQTDFWTFDDNVLLMWYDQIGRYIGGIIVDKADSIPFLDFREKILAKSEKATVDKLREISKS